MNADEKQKLKDRIEAAEELEDRRSVLEDSIEKLASDEVRWLKFNVKGDQEEMFYADEKDGSYYRVCWFSKEKGLREAILEFLMSELRTRLDEARERYNNL